MKRLHKAIMSFGIVAVLLAGSSSVFAKSENPRERAISGSIVRIDRNTRTITVREQSTGRETRVKVPAGSVLRTNQETSQPNQGALAYWASGLQASYLEGAFKRAVRPHTLRVPRA